MKKSRSGNHPKRLTMSYCTAWTCDQYQRLAEGKDTHERN